MRKNKYDEELEEARSIAWGAVCGAAYHAARGDARGAAWDAAAGATKGTTNGTAWGVAWEEELGAQVRLTLFALEKVEEDIVEIDELETIWYVEDYRNAL